MSGVIGDLAPSVLGPELREMRKKSGLTQKDLAARLGIQQSLVSKREQGTVGLFTDDVERWAAACGFRAELAFEHLAVHRLKALEKRIADLEAELSRDGRNTP